MDSQANPREGETKTTTRRLSDIPPSGQPRDWKPDEEEQNTRKPMLQGAQETVARALGGASRGGLLVCLAYCLSV